MYKHLGLKLLIGEKKKDNSIIIIITALIKYCKLIHLNRYK